MQPLGKLAFSILTLAGIFTLYFVVIMGTLRNKSKHSKKNKEIVIIYISFLSVLGLSVPVAFFGLITRKSPTFWCHGTFKGTFLAICWIQTKKNFKFGILQHLSFNIWFTHPYRKSGVEDRHKDRQTVRQTDRHSRLIYWPSQDLLIIQWMNDGGVCRAASSFAWVCLIFRWKRIAPNLPRCITLSDNRCKNLAKHLSIRFYKINFIFSYQKDKNKVSLAEPFMVV